jgi:hypothetical protein
MWFDGNLDFWLKADVKQFSKIERVLIMKKLSLMLGLFVMTISSLVFAQTPAPADAKIYIISPVNGETVSQTFVVRFGLKNMGVAPAGTEKPNTGHHHLLIDQAVLPPMDQPMGNAVKHFGAGQTETELTLAPGKHTLQLIFGDASHRPHNSPVISEKIEITVK